MRLRVLVAVMAICLLTAPAISAQAADPTESALTVEAKMCAGVEERMPTGAAEAFSADVGQVWCWCKVTGATDTTMIKHVWSRDGEQMAVVELPVRSAAWRTWSSKNILPHWTGKWEVKIMDAEDNVLMGLKFTVRAAAAAPATPAAQPAEKKSPADTGK